MKFNPPNRIHESNIQAEIYRLLGNLGIDCYLEYKIYIPELNCSCFADVAIIVNGYVVLLIEVKSRKKCGLPNSNGKQYKKYEAIRDTMGVPFMYCMNSADIALLMHKVSAFVNK